MQFFPWMFLTIQAAIVAASLLGYGIFTSRPDWLAQVDPQARFFTWAFRLCYRNMFFGGYGAADAILRTNFSALKRLVAVYTVSLGSELRAPLRHSLVRTLIPATRTQWFGLSVLIPLSLFTMTGLLYDRAPAVGGLQAVLLGAALLVSWIYFWTPR